MFRIYVGNLSFNTSKESLQALFAQHGAVNETYIGTDRETGRSRGFGFVTMQERSAGEAAIAALNGREFEGRNLVVNEAQPRAPRAGAPGGGYSGGGGGYSGGRGGGYGGGGGGYGGGGYGGAGGGGGGGEHGGGGGGSGPGSGRGVGPKGGRERGDRRRERDDW